MGIETAIAIAGAVAGLATAGVGVAGALQKPPEAPQAPKPQTDEELTAVTRANEKERKRLAASRAGQGSTILTSPLGAEDQSTVGSATLLGQ